MVSASVGVVGLLTVTALLCLAPLLPALIELLTDRDALTPTASLSAVRAEGEAAAALRD